MSVELTTLINKLMKRTLAFLLLGMLVMQTYAQTDSKFSQSMFLTPMYNPGSVGITDKLVIAASFRNQWIGMQAPVATTFSADAPLNFLGRTHGLGITLMNDNLALNNDFLFHLVYAYQLEIGNGKLGIGLNAGIVNQSLTADWYYADVMQSGDPSVPQQDGSVFAFDMGLGAFYRTEALYAGISITHLNQPHFDYPEDTAEPIAARHYYATAGYVIQLANPMIELMPSFLIQSDLKINHIYLNTNVRYNKKFWGGVSYSIAGELTALVGIDLMNGAKIGYSYDVDLSPMVKYSSGSHELTVRYNFDMSLDKKPQKYKSIRIM